MATVITSSTTTTGNNIALASGVDLFVAPGVVRASTAGLALSAPYSTHAIDVLGTLYGEVAGASLGGAATASNRLYVGAQGAVTGHGTGLTTFGDLVAITNAGQISGNRGVIHDGPGVEVNNSGVIAGSYGDGINVSGESAQIVNSGTISGANGGAGIVLDLTNGPSDSVSIVNTGMISGTHTGIEVSSAFGASIFNLGTITGITNPSGVVDISNDGVITRSLWLGAGNDSYHGYGDGRVLGAIWGEGGNDTLIGGDRHDEIWGGDGNDLLDGGDGRDKVYGDAGDDTITAGDDGRHDIYDGSTGTDTLSYETVASDLVIRADLERARGEGIGHDTITGFEVVWGGTGDDLIVADAIGMELNGWRGADTLRGGRGDDKLVGGPGRDTLIGKAGADTLMGWTGNDKLTGGRGADTFVFSDGFGRDRITGFAAKNDAEKIDLSGVTAITGFADLQNNHMTQHGSDVWITDAVDRIVLAGVDIHDLDAADFIF